MGGCLTRVQLANEDNETDRSFIPDTNYTATLRQLDVPLGPCHIQVLELPARYRQPVDEKRLDNCFISDSEKKQLEKNYPTVSQYVCVSRSWMSADKKAIALLIYHELGPFLLFSKNSGKAWSAPLYLGLHRLPEAAWYAPLADSKFPMIADGRVRIEVTIWKQDKSKPGSPLLGYSYLWKKWNQYLSMSIADLQRDSDGDGLTDLFEERILTDPHSVDTDRDGIPDGSDNQPLTPFPKRLTESDRIVLALMPARPSPVINSIFAAWRIREGLTETPPMILKDGMIISELTHEILTRKGLAYYTAPHPVKIPMDHTSIIVAAGDSFPHVTGDARVMVFNQPAFEKYRRKFPDESCGYAGSFDLRYNAARNKAVLELFEGNYGCTIKLRKEDGRWKGEETSFIYCD